MSFGQNCVFIIFYYLSFFTFLCLSLLSFVFHYFSLFFFAFLCFLSFSLHYQNSVFNIFNTWKRKCKAALSFSSSKMFSSPASIHFCSRIIFSRQLQYFDDCSSMCGSDDGQITSNLPTSISAYTTISRSRNLHLFWKTKLICFLELIHFSWCSTNCMNNNLRSLILDSMDRVSMYRVSRKLSEIFQK